MAATGSKSAFTLTELVVLLAVLGVLVVLGLSIWSPPRRVSAPRIKCVNNLKNIGLACRIFSTDQTDRFPSQTSTNEGGCAEFRSSPDAAMLYFRSLSNELAVPSLLICPADTRKPAQTFSNLQNVNVSYFVGWLADESHPDSLLAGDRSIVRTNGWLMLQTNTFIPSTPAWHGGYNVVLGDGSVQQLSAATLRQMLTNTAVTNLLVLP